MNTRCPVLTTYIAFVLENVTAPAAADLYAEEIADLRSLLVTAGTVPAPTQRARGARLLSICLEVLVAQRPYLPRALGEQLARSCASYLRGAADFQSLSALLAELQQLQEVAALDQVDEELLGERTRAWGGSGVLVGPAKDASEARYTLEQFLPSEVLLNAAHACVSSFRAACVQGSNAQALRAETRYACEVFRLVNVPNQALWHHARTLAAHDCYP